MGLGPLANAVATVQSLNQASWLSVMLVAVVVAMAVSARSRSARKQLKLASRGRVAVISGGGTGISLHIAQELLARGFIVFSGEFDRKLRRKRTRSIDCTEGNGGMVTGGLKDNDMLGAGRVRGVANGSTGAGGGLSGSGGNRLNGGDGGGGGGAAGNGMGGIGGAVGNGFVGGGLDPRDNDLEPPVANDMGVYAHYLDVRSDASVDDFFQFVRQALRALGLPPAVHVLVNNATVVNACPLEHVDRGTLLDTLNVQIGGSLAVTQRFLPHMIMASRQSKWKARVINMCSGAALVPAPVYGAYCIGKAGLSALCDVLRQELLLRRQGEAMRDGVGDVCVTRIEFAMCSTHAARGFEADITQQMESLFPPGGRRGGGSGEEEDDEEDDHDDAALASKQSIRRIRLPAENPYRQMISRAIGLHNNQYNTGLSPEFVAAGIVSGACAPGVNRAPANLQIGGEVMAAMVLRNFFPIFIRDRLLQGFHAWYRDCKLKPPELIVVNQASRKQAVVSTVRVLSAVCVLIMFVNLYYNRDHKGAE